MFGKRAQVFTVEGILAALVVLAGVAFAIQAAPLSPGASSATSEPVDQGHLSSVLSQTAENGSLERAILSWDQGFHGASGTEFYTSPLGTYDLVFLETLDDALDNTLAANVVLRFRDDSGDRHRQRMLYRGAPGGSAVRASTTVALYDDDVLYDSSEEPTSAAVTPDTFYAPDTSPSTDLYNVVEVEVVVWQT